MNFFHLCPYLKSNSSNSHHPRGHQELWVGMGMRQRGLPLGVRRMGRPLYASPLPSLHPHPHPLGLSHLVTA